MLLSKCVHICPLRVHNCPFYTCQRPIRSPVFFKHVHKCPVLSTIVHMLSTYCPLCQRPIRRSVSLDNCGHYVDICGHDIGHLWTVVDSYVDIFVYTVCGHYCSHVDKCGHSVIPTPCTCRRGTRLPAAFIERDTTRSPRSSARARRATSRWVRRPRA